jgi:low temperature requirement protein LtrA
VARGALWTVAIAIDYGALFLRLPVPRLGRPPEAELPVVAEHVSERYPQFFIIALGELILVTGIEASRSDLKPAGATAFVVSFVTTVQFWRIYIYRAGERLPAAIAAAPLPGRLAVWLSGVHLLMVIGIVTAAAGFELVIGHPTGHTDAARAVVTLGGPAVFLVARGAFEYAVFHRVSWSRPVGALVLAAAVPAAVHTPPVIAAVAAAAVLTGVSIVDATRGHAAERRLAARSG